jgi:hypothetical protein
MLIQSNNRAKTSRPVAQKQEQRRQQDVLSGVPELLEHDERMV